MRNTRNEFLTLVRTYLTKVRTQFIWNQQFLAQYYYQQTGGWGGTATKKPSTIYQLKVFLPRKEALATLFYLMTLK